MRNRIPTFPNRIKLKAIEGQTDTYDMERADEPVEEGTPLNVATLFSDEAANIWGLTDATPNDAFIKIKEELDKNTKWHIIGENETTSDNVSVVNIELTEDLIQANECVALLYADANNYGVTISIGDYENFFIVGNVSDITRDGSAVQVSRGIINIDGVGKVFVLIGNVIPENVPTTKLRFVANSGYIPSGTRIIVLAR